ncbi:MAG: SusC/RagA family TonB-linked outer membrane protein [Bacteroidia bacterium]
MKKMLRASAILLFVMCCGFLNAQTRIVSGTVKGTDGKPIPYVVVQVKGTTIATSTDTSGKFSLGVNTGETTLVFSSIGVKKQEVAISDNMNVTMQSDLFGLDEFVVTAIGISAEKKSLGYATQVVNGDELNNSGTGNMMSELDGKVAGLTVINSAGDPGAGTYMTLRGVTSLTGNNQPLMVVDGIPIDNSINNYDPTNAGFAAGGASGGLTGGAQPTNRGLDINPSDIESITVLKGPAAAALYGIQAASGAIVITTKKGSAVGGPKIEFNSSESWSSPDKLPELQNQWAQGNNGIYQGPDSSGSDKKFSWGPAISTLKRTGVANQWDRNGDISPTGTVPVTPYNQYNFFQTGVTADNNIAFSGGNSKSNYRISLGNLHQTGIIPGTKYNKTNFSINGETALSKKLSITAGVNYINSFNNKAQQGSQVSGVMLGLLRTPATFDNSYGQKNPVDSSAYVLPNGNQRSYRGGGGYDNPYWTVNRDPYTEGLNRVFGTTQLNYQALSWMMVTYRIGGDVYFQSDKDAYDIGSNQFPAGYLYTSDYFNSQFNSDFIVNMNHKFSDDLSGNLILGQNFFDLRSQNRFATGSNFSLPNFLDLSNAQNYQASESEAGKRTSAWYGEGQLNWKSQLFLTLTGRDETTSTLAPGHNNFFYPSVSAAWVFTDALKLTTNKIFPYGKLRMSYAQVGQDAPIEALQTYYSQASIKDGYTTGVTFPFNGQAGYQISSPTSVIGNSGLLPENTNSYEIGTDLIFFQNRVSLSATYYYENTTDEIFTVPIPYSTGFASALFNLGQVTNKGIELTLNTTPVKLKNGFTWDLGFNWSKNVNEVVALAPGVNSLFLGGFTGGGVYALPGQPYGVIYGTDYVRDGSGNMIIDDIKTDPGYGMPIVGTQSVPLGNIQPKWIGGINNAFTFKNITLGIILNVREGGSMWDGTLGALEYFGTAQQTANRGQNVVFSGNAGHLDANGNIAHNNSSGTEVTGEGAANNVTAQYNEYYWQNIGSSFGGPTSANVYDVSFVRVGQMSLTYSFPEKWIKKAHFTKLSLTAFANNPFLWTKYPGVDPETSLGGPANGQGLDYFNNPGIKSYGVRLNVGL